MTIWVLVFAAINAVGGLRVETGTPAALCPDIGEVRRAVRDRLSVEGEGEWLASYDLVHRPSANAGDVVRVELRDPAGRVRLQRDLPRSGESCVALAQAVALLLESFFRHPADPPVDHPNASASAATAAPATAPASAAPTIAAAAPAGPSALGWGPALDVFGAWSGGPSSPGVAIDVWYGGRAASSWAAGVEGVWLTAEKTVDIDFGAGRGTGTVRSALLRGWVARRLRLAPIVEILAGPELVMVVDRMVETTGVPGGMSNHREAFGAGARVHARLRLAPRTTLSLVTALDYTPRTLAPRFDLGGPTGGQDLYPSPQVRLFVGVGLGVALFP
jgi:hypothetical protein